MMRSGNGSSRAGGVSTVAPLRRRFLIPVSHGAGVGSDRRGANGRIRSLGAAPGAVPSHSRIVFRVHGSTPR